MDRLVAAARGTGPHPPVAGAGTPEAEAVPVRLAALPRAPQPS